jgi:flagellar basal-body rod protein FlgG
MVNGLYTSGAGMMLSLRRQELTSNNLANAQTTGFKISRLATHDTVQVGRDVDNFMRQREQQRADEVHLDWSSGPLIQTGNPLDVAIRGNGFLAVSTPDGERYLRSANLKLNSDHELVDPSGSRILDQGGNPVKVAGTKATITADGRVLSDGQEAATLKIVDFPQPYQLRQEGNGRYVPYAAQPGEDAPKPIAVSANTRLEQGYIEGPNVNTVAEMVRMISQFRDYEASSKVLHSIDGTLDRAVNQVGRV